TRPSLLVRLRDARDSQAWTQFVQVYGPVVYNFARKRGLQAADAADLTQDVLRAVAGAASRLEYDPARGSFRSWLFRVVRNRLRDFLASRQRRLQGTGLDRTQHVLGCHLRRPQRLGRSSALAAIAFRRRSGPRPTVGEMARPLVLSLA